MLLPLKLKPLLYRFRLLKHVSESPLLFYVVTVTGVSNGFVLPFLKNINIEVTRSVFIVGLGEGLFIIILATIGIAWGLIFDNVERRNLVMFLAMEGAALFIFLTSRANSPTGYLVCRLVTGFFVSAVYAFIMSVVTDVYGAGERIYTFLAVYLLMNFMMGLGSAVALFLAVYINWRKVIFLYSLILGLGALILLVSKEAPRGGAERDIIKLKRFGVIRRSIIKYGIGEVKDVFKYRTNIYIILQGFFGCIPWGAMGLFLIYALMEKTGGTFITIGTLFALSGIFYPISLIFAPRIDKLRLHGKYGSLVVITIAIILTQTLLFVVAMSIPLPKMSAPEGIKSQIMLVLDLIHNGYIVAMVVVYGGFICVASFAGPITRNIIADVNEPRRRATAIMVIRLFESMGNAIGIIIAGLIIDLNSSFVAPFKYIWISWIACGLLWIPIMRSYPADSEKMRLSIVAQLL